MPCILERAATLAVDSPTMSGYSSDEDAVNGDHWKGEYQENGLSVSAGSIDNRSRVSAEVRVKTNRGSNDPVTFSVGDGAGRVLNDGDSDIEGLLDEDADEIESRLIKARRAQLERE